MAETVQDSTGARVSVELDEQNSAFVVKDDSGQVAGRAHYLAGPDPDRERIFHHTVVDEEFSGRGLSKILVSHALKDASNKGLTAVPVCSVFAKRLSEHGDDYRAIGGRYRQPTNADRQIVDQHE